MSLLCKLFGHKLPVAFGEHSQMGGGDYLNSDGPPMIDGIGRAHFTILGTCGRCGKLIKIGMMHGFQIAQHLEPAMTKQMAVKDLRIAELCEELIDARYKLSSHHRQN